MSKERLSSEPAPDTPKEPNDGDQPPAPKPKDNVDSIFDSPNKTVLPPDTREDAIDRGDIEVPPIGARRGSSLGAYGEKGRRARRTKKE